MQAAGSQRRLGEPRGNRDTTAVLERHVSADVSDRGPGKLLAARRHSVAATSPELVLRAATTMGPPPRRRSPGTARSPSAPAGPRTTAIATDDAPCSPTQFRPVAARTERHRFLRLGRRRRRDFEGFRFGLSARPSRRDRGRGHPAGFEEVPGGSPSTMRCPSATGSLCLADSTAEIGT